MKKKFQKLFILNSKLNFLLFLLLTGVFISCEEQQDLEYESAIFYAEQRGSSTFMGVFPDVPKQIPKSSQMIHLGNEGAAFSYTNSKSVFSIDYSDKTIYKWRVDKKLNLTKADSMKIENIESPSNIVIYSDTRAFIVYWALKQILEWNPSTMTISKIYDIPFTESDEEDIIRGWSKAGDRIVAAIGNYKYDKAIVAVFDVNTLTMDFIEDDRLISVSSYFTMSNGDIYLYPDIGFTRGRYYNSEIVDKKYRNGKVLRILSGQNQFDPDFEIDLFSILDTEFIYEVYPLTDTKWLVEYLQIGTPLPSNVWESLNILFFTNVNIKLIDINNNLISDINGLNEIQSSSYLASKLYVDGQLYYQKYEYQPSGDTHIVKQIIFGKLSVNGDFEPFFKFPLFQYRGVTSLERIDLR